MLGGGEWQWRQRVHDREDSGLGDLTLKLGLGELNSEVEVAKGEDDLRTDDSKDVEPRAQGWRGGHHRHGLRQQAERPGYDMARNLRKISGLDPMTEPYLKLAVSDLDLTVGKHATGLRGRQFIRINK
jgi:hypothetical protein